MLFSIANAADVTETATSQGGIMNFLPLIAIFTVFYFLMIRPQSKRVKAEKTMRDNLKIGNKVITTSGIFGTITEIDSEAELISISISKGTEVTMYKSSIASILNTKEPENTKTPKKIKADKSQVDASQNTDTPENKG